MKLMLSLLTGCLRECGASNEKRLRFDFRRSKRRFARFTRFTFVQTGWAGGSTCSGREAGIAADEHVMPMSKQQIIEHEEGGRDVSWIVSASKVAADSPGD
ncbi:MAG: hypothetical protein GY825_03630 [Phycisphaeraceae bacterium]|nr:hypothetical protein [Phycisphaeraceae bacterium]